MGGAACKKVTARIESRPMVSLDCGAARWWCGSGGARVLWENGGGGVESSATYGARTKTKHYTSSRTSSGRGRTTHFHCGPSRPHTM